MDIKSIIRTIPDYPKPGIMFRDVTTLLGNARAFRTTVDLLVQPYAGTRIDKVAGIEARGFIIAAPVAYRLGAGLVPVRKKGKLPYDVRGIDYTLEYGAERLEVHSDAVSAGDKVVVIDDVLATGGTARAACEILRELEADIVGVGVVIELSFLPGRETLGDIDVFSLITY